MTETSSELFAKNLPIRRLKEMVVSTQIHPHIKYNPGAQLG